MHFLCDSKTSGKFGEDLERDFGVDYQNVLHNASHLFILVSILT